MKRICLPSDIEYGDYNTNNLHENDPYIVTDDGELIIDKEWWDHDVPEYSKELIRRRVEFKLGKVEIPHEIMLDMDLVVIYQAYQEGFEFPHWYKNIQEMKDTIVIKLNPMMKQLFVQNKDEKDKDMSLVREYINSKIGKDGLWFVKTGCTSGKNESALQPLKNGDEIVDRLLEIREFQHRDFAIVDKDTYIIIRPWNDKINARNEFRLFVVNRKITGASPQKWAQCHNYTEDELDIVENSILNADLLRFSPYDTFVADVYIDFDTKICHLIEFNCFGDHSGAGSSLFNWRTDRDILYGLTQPELRFLSPINLYP